MKKLIKKWGLTSVILCGTLGGYMTYVFILAIINTICDCIQKGTMNIFFLHETPEKSAEYHCDKHVPKMILETAQMLSTAYRRNFDDGDELYKTAYPKHPSTIWMGDSGDNFFWGIRLLDKLIEQFTMRYGKVHKTIRISNLFHSKYKRWHDWKTPFTTPPQCMPDEYKHDNYITAYRNYFKGAKRYFAKWDKLNNKPDWWIE